jgi:hypothetical protein
MSNMAMVITGIVLIVIAILLFVIGQLILFRRQKKILESFRDPDDTGEG